MADFPKKQQQCLIPKYLLDYLGDVNELHPDPSDLGGGDNIEPGTGIVITGDETKTISVDDETVAMVANLSTVAFSGSYSNLSDKPDLSVYELKEDAFTGDYEDLTNKPDLSVYELKSEAFSGNYNDLTNKPDLSVYAETADLGDCAYLDEDELSIAYSQITGTPTIPTKTSELTNDSGYITGVTWNDVTGKPTFATVATTGDYDDLTNKPTIPVVPTNVSAFNNDAGYITGIDSTDVITALGYTPGTSNFSGSYTDLTDKPTIPTATSQLTNDSGFITSASLTGYVPFETVSGMPLIEAGNYYGPGYEPGLTNYNMLTQTRNTFKLPINKSGTIALTSDIPSMPTNYVTTDTTQTITARKTIVGASEGLYIQSGPNWTSYDTMILPGQIMTNSISGTSISASSELVFGDVTTVGQGQIRVRDFTVTPFVDYRITVPKANGTMALTSDIPTVPTNVSAFTNDAGYITGITSSDVTTALGYTPGTSNFTGFEVIAMTESQGTISASDYAKLGVNTIITRSETNTSNVWTYTYLGDNDTYIKYGRTIPQYSSGSSNGEFKFQYLLIKKTASPNKTHAISFGYNIYHVQVPTVNDSTITITQGGVTKGSFTLNQNTNQTINVDDAPGMIGEVIYDVPNGEAGVNPITMAHSFADYSYVDIQYRCYDNAYEVKSVRVYDPNGKHVYLDWDVLVSGTVYAKKSIYILNGNTMTVKDGTDMQVWYSNGSTMGTQVTPTTDYQHQIKITKVIGYKANSSALTSETWTFTLQDGTTTTKKIMLG